MRDLFNPLWAFLNSPRKPEKDDWNDVALSPMNTEDMEVSLPDNHMPVVGLPLYIPAVYTQHDQNRSSRF